MAGRIPDLKSFATNDLVEVHRQDGSVYDFDLAAIFGSVEHVQLHGADPTGLTDSTAAIQAAIDAAATATALDPSVPAYTWITELEGGVVFFAPGWYRIDSKLTLPDRVSLVGLSYSRCTIVAGSGFSDSTMIDCVEGTDPLFDSRICNLRIHANNLAGIDQVIHAQAWQELCELKRVAISGYQGEGILIDDVSSGAARFLIDDCFFAGFSNNTAAIHVETTVPNSFLLQVTQTTIDPSGTATNGIHVENGRLYGRDLHIENCTNGIHMEGGNAILHNITGNGDTTSLITANASFNGSIEMTGIDANGSTRTFDDNVTSADITASFSHARFPFSPQFSTNDATPTVSKQAPCYRTFNTSPTTITDFDSGVSGQEFLLRIQDSNTTIDIGTNILRADDVGTDLTPSNGTFYRVYNDRGTWIVAQG